MSQQAKKKLSTGKIVLIVILCLILLLAGVVAYMLTHYVGLLGELRDEEKGASVTTSANGENNGEEQVIAPTNIADDVFTFLLIGVDSRQDTYTGRSDSQMLISLNQ
ncbi:MAG: hypothetical protein J6T14_08675, partial [Clostridia bacterium]|nr:hypothetical protein [Clostridia bacterium]